MQPTTTYLSNPKRGPLEPSARLGARVWRGNRATPTGSDGLPKGQLKLCRACVRGFWGFLGGLAGFCLLLLLTWVEEVGSFGRFQAFSGVLGDFVFWVAFVFAFAEIVLLASFWGVVGGLSFSF